MKLIKSGDFTYPYEIKAAALQGSDLVFLTSEKQVMRQALGSKETEQLFPVFYKGLEYSDGGFDCDAPTTIYTMDSIVVIVNDYKQHGFIHYPGNYEKLHIWRGEYHADITRYPIALFKHNGSAHLIFAKDWNRVEIMNLDTRQILTAAKSLIEDGAEEKHIEFYQKHKETNKLPWPSPFDYFFGPIVVAPDEKHFFSNGWVWGSSDCINCFHIDTFIKETRIHPIHVSWGEHENRTAVWISNNTIAVPFNPEAEGDGSESRKAHEFHIYSMTNSKFECTHIIPVEGIAVTQFSVSFDLKLNCFILCSKQAGFAVVSLEGKVLFFDESLKADGYYNGMVLVKDQKTIALFQLHC